METYSGILDCYVPRVLLRWLREAPEQQVRMLEGTVVFVDLSGFTRLSERLARFGREGSEQLTDAINGSFSSLLGDAYIAGGSLLKFGGDALLLWFEGPDHPLRACSTAVRLRRRLREIGRIQAGAGTVVLRMSIGVHTGSFGTFLVGDSHREYLIAGPAVSRVVAIEAAAQPGQILISPETAAGLPSRCLGEAVGPGVLLMRAPASAKLLPAEVPTRVPDAVVAGCLSTELRSHATGMATVPEHRTAVVSFLQFGGVDTLVSEHGPDAAARALDQLVRTVQAAADRYRVCFLGSDITADGGKLLLTAGAPRVLGDDEERMLLAMRQVIEADPPLPVRIGINRGHVFAGEVGPHYRRTYTVMGDAVNLAARLMTNAPWGGIYATPAVLERSQARFRLSDVPPFMVKGKSRPVTVVEVGAGLRIERPAARGWRTPLIGRDRELAVVRDALHQALEGAGRMVEIVGETGSGKSRLLTEARELAQELRFVHSTGETYTQTTPYASWRDVLRQLLGVAWDAPDAVVLERLGAELEAVQPDLIPWTALLAIALDVESPSSPEVDQLTDEARQGRLQETVLRFLEPALARPTLLEIEHAHLMDAASAALLVALIPKLRASSWLVLVTRRDADHGFEAPADEVTRLDLGPLAFEQALALAEATPHAARLPPHLLELAVERSGGSPELLLDLLAAADGSGAGRLPESVDAAATAWIDALGPDDRAFVRRAAVLGVSFHERRLANVLPVGLAEPDAAAWERLGTIFARDPDGHVRFKRPALREVAYAGLPFRLRRELHSALVRALEDDLGTDVDADPAVLSLHSILAGDPERGWRYARLGGERAAVRFAHADAARLYRRAIEAGGDGGATDAELSDAFERLAEELRLCGQPGEALTALASARRLARHDPMHLAQLFYAQAEICAQTGRLTASVRAVNQGLGLLGALDGELAGRWRARLTSTLAAVRGRQGRARDAAKLAQAVIDLAETVDAPRALAHACYVLDWALVELGRPGEAVHSARALAIYRELGIPDREAIVLNNLGMFAYFRGDWDEAVELYEQAAVCGVRAGDATVPAFAYMNIAEILSDQGKLEEATEHLNRSRRTMNATGDNDSVPFVDALLARVAIRSGRHDEALELLQQARADFVRMGMGLDADFVTLLIAEAEAYGASPSRALETLAEIRRARDPYVPMVLRLRGIAHALLRDRTAATAELERSLEAARARAADYEIALALDALEAVGPGDPERRRERDAILARLGVTALRSPVSALPGDLPTPQLGYRP